MYVQKYIQKLKLQQIHTEQMYFTAVFSHHRSTLKRFSTHANTAILSLSDWKIWKLARFKLYRNSFADG